MKPLTSEKAVKLIELNNTLMFEVDRKMKKPEIKKEIEETFKVKVDSVNSSIRKNKKIVYVKLNEKTPASDVAMKLGIM